MLKKEVALSVITKNIVRDGVFQSLENTNSLFPKTLAYCDNIKYLNMANCNPNVTCIIVTPELQEMVSGDKGVVAVENPRELFYEIYQRFYENDHFMKLLEKKIALSAKIDPTAIYSENCTIGENVFLGQRVVIGENVIIEDNVRIEAGAVIGTNGILFYKKNGVNTLVEHAGGVIIKNGAVILANSTVVSSVSSNKYTEVGEAAIIGIGSIIGHGALIEKNCVVSGNSVIAREAIMRESSYIGTGSIMREYVTLEMGAKAMAGSVIVANVEADSAVSGNFAYSHKKHLRDFTKKIRG